LADMNACARAELARNCQIIIFPEGTRRPPGAEPRYKYGVVHLYRETGVTCLPTALNSGLFWPRRSMRRYPGIIRVEVLDPIPPGLEKEAFSERLQRDVEAATARLVAEGERDFPRNARGAPAPPTSVLRGPRPPRATVGDAPGLRCRKSRPRLVRPREPFGQQM